MSVQCSAIIKLLEQLAPTALSEDWDNVGLQVGDQQAQVQKVMVALNASEDVVQQAIAQKADFLLTHHPLIFKPIKAVTADSAVGCTVTALIAHRINLYCAHTNLDIAAGGVNDVLAKAIGLQDIALLSPTQTMAYYKLAVYVPAGYEEQVRGALCTAGAGCVGAYQRCTFQTAGTGTFLPDVGTNPFLGEPGQMTYAEEYRLETIVPAQHWSAVQAALLAAHPYEEVAYDLFRLENINEQVGIGRIGQLPTAITLADFLRHIRRTLAIDVLNYSGDLQQCIRTVALCGGSGASYLQEAWQKQADVYLTGDLKYHDAQLAKELGIAVVDAGHFATEHLIVERLVGYLQTKLVGCGVDVVAMQGEHDFIQTFQG